ncbi:hypothetical protein HO151_03925 [Streptomyces sp. 8P21H-1]|nr:hypothetical protein [Streptomyces sp. 8P21H-1]
MAEVDEPLVSDVSRHHELKPVTVLLHRGPAPGGHIGPAIAAWTGADNENPQVGQDLASFRPQVTDDDLNGMPLEERTDM